MTRIETDPEALVAMGRELKRASSSIEEAIRKVRSTLNATKWNDPVRRELEQNLEAIARMAKQIDNVSNDSQRMLNRKAGELRTYLGR
ncbi:hypothetical protein [Gordonia sp. (in: high G+C Gram-positive bacteria)]|jgi:ABC-type transporter Mla subunit MlaD|uniref:hypothetical protein n=1 Tax=Gordonia sp. (in: high G+C Gram-positive bacteria) TaxID=84139 RepID=UPI001E071A75|nr:hypothetical protein [Gordonia sp. (in: high G+C Gram-positive bacteria)]MCB1293609.1 hypothetical protein [Gordonia sp. (in: high G+C Gram-positive bacteria)]HMS76420.1 hypothetical protein [Gordonia sp. (in: high G+C Gram-positive bacteria)]HQV16845.1 hypothetical protein [Gordonia sp. (in: high G+C Gram-positive bacteria)]